MHLFIEKGMTGGISGTLLKDLIKPKVNTWSDMTTVNQVNISCSLMQIIYILGQWVNIFLTVNLNG